LTNTRTHTTVEKHVTMAVEERAPSGNKPWPSSRRRCGALGRSRSTVCCGGGVWKISISVDGWLRGLLPRTYRGRLLEYANPSRVGQVDGSDQSTFCSELNSRLLGFWAGLGTRNSRLGPRSHNMG
jgi:hypothetical protein